MDCLVKYKRDCLDSHWRLTQAHKFYFANFLGSRVNLRVQSPSAIHEICTRIQKKDFYFSDSATKIEGIQFLKSSGNDQFTESLSLDDVEIFKTLEEKPGYGYSDFDAMSISFSAMSGWLGTLLPEKFLPVTSTHFRHSISHLFDRRLLIYDEPDYDYFIWSQQCFHITKECLKEFELRALYLADINSYMSMQYPKYTGKRFYSEADWNWLTQDFHLFVFREMLHLDNVRYFSTNISEELAKSGFDLPEGIDIYMPSQTPA